MVLSPPIPVSVSINDSIRVEQMSFSKFCIYTLSVNSKFTTRHKCTRNLFINWQATRFAVVLYIVSRASYFLSIVLKSSICKDCTCLILIFTFFWSILFVGLLWRGVAVFGTLHQHCGGLCWRSGGVRGQGNSFLNGSI